MRHVVRQLDLGLFVIDANELEALVFVRLEPALGVGAFQGIVFAHALDLSQKKEALSRAFYDFRSEETTAALARGQIRQYYSADTAFSVIA